MRLTWFQRNLLFTLLVSIFLFSGCATPQTVPFESVMKGDRSDWKWAKPFILVTADAEALSALFPPWNLNEAEIPLTQVDLSTYGLIAVFQGYQGTGGYGIEAQRIQRVGTRVEIYAQFISPEPHDLVTLGTTSPYHIVRVRRADLPSAGQITWVLRNETTGEEVIQEKYTFGN